MPEPAVVAPEDVDVVDFVYRVDGDNQLQLDELVSILTALGDLIQEGNRVLNPDSPDIQVAVKPFEKGSFTFEMPLWMDTVNALYALLHGDSVEKIKFVLETLGLIAVKSKVGFVSLLQLYRNLKGQPPKDMKEVEPGKTWALTGQDDTVTQINGPVQNVYQNCTFNSGIHVAYSSPLEKPRRKKVQTYIKDDAESLVEVDKEQAESLREIPAPEPPEQQPEERERTDIVFLHPRRGSFEGNGDKWSFRMGSQRGEIITANIKAQDFLHKLETGEYRLSAGDVLKVELREKQRVIGTQIRLTREILKVLEYRPAPKQNYIDLDGEKTA